MVRFGQLRGLIGAMVVAAACLMPTGAWAASPMTPTDIREFNLWKERYLLPDGRVVDTGNGGISHSEGQSYGLLLTEAFGDQDDFDNILTWTRLHLSRPYDRLFAWRYKPGEPNPVEDLNNATDGDMVIAWALLRAGKDWNEPSYTDMGKQVASAILRLCVTSQNGRLVLLPADKGFTHQTSTTINLSYYLFAAIRTLAAAVPDPRWQQLEYDGRKLLGVSQFGVWKLPPDWESLAVNAAEQPAEGWPARFSWDAVRVPLQAVWAGIITDPGPVWNAARFWSSPHTVPFPAWTDLLEPNLAPYSGNSGVGAVAILSSSAILHQGTRNDLPSVSSAPNYYAASLIMLSRLAWIEALDHPPAPAPYPIAPADSTALQAALAASGTAATPASSAAATPPPMTAITTVFGWNSSQDSQAVSSVASGAAADHTTQH
jgi:endo-1,4-beta-D-glucanase Y